MTASTDETPSTGTGNSYLTREDEGYHKGLGNRQIQMIGIGGAIGTGLFMGAGLKLHSAGPGLFVAYGLCGVFVFFILRALGELVLHRPSSGSFVSYSREFLGEKAAYAVGWMVFLNWAMTSIADTNAVAAYISRWVKTDIVPGWVWALAALAIVLSVNMISVKWFGEMEFWAALIKVVALVTVLVVAVVVLIWGMHLTAHTPPGEKPAPVAEWDTGFSMVSSAPGGWFPHGLFPLLVVLSSVVFAYSAVELVGTAAGEAKDPATVMPKAINAVLLRIFFFYVGSVLLLALLVPYLNFGSGSPFVTFFSSLGAPWAGDVMNAVVITSAMSSLNAGLYSTGRIVRSLAMNGSAPQALGKMNSSGVPYPGILLTCCFTVIGVLLNYVLQDAKEVFSIAVEMAAIGVMGGWASILVCQLQFFKLAKQGLAVRPAFRMPWAPYSNYASLAFLLLVVVMMGLPKSDETEFIKKYEGTVTVGAFFFVVVPLLVLGWFLLRDRVNAIAQERIGYTGKFPVVANLPVNPGNIPLQDSDGARHLGAGPHHGKHEKGRSVEAPPAGD